MKRRTLVASWDGQRPKGTEMRRVRPEFKDPQRWLVVIHMVQPARVNPETGVMMPSIEDLHTVKAPTLCPLLAMFPQIDKSLAELGEGDPVATKLRMDFYV